MNISISELLLVTLAGIVIAFPVTAIENENTGRISDSGKSRKTITLLHTNDIHGNHMPFTTTTDNTTAQTGDLGRDRYITFDKDGKIGGFAALVTAIKQVREKEGKENVLLVDSGDTFSDDLLGNFTKGKAVIEMMNAVGYDFMALGNHDFDYGRDRTEELQQMADFPFRAANIIDEPSGQSIFGEPYIIKEFEGMKVAILALGYHNTNLTGNKDNFKDLNFRKGTDVLEEILPDLKKRADIIVVLSHQGTAVDKLTAEKFEEIDLIIGGHSHDLLEESEKINNTYIVQAMADAAVLGDTKLVIESQKLVGVESNHHLLWHDDFEKDAKTEKLIDRLRKPYKDELEEKIAVAKGVIGRQYKSESAFDKLVGNLLREEFQAQISLLPGVGYGISLMGTITKEAVVNLIPHPNEIVTATLTGEQILNTLEQTATNQKSDDPTKVVGGLLQTSGIVFTIDYNQPKGGRVSIASLNGAPIEPSKTYRVVTQSGMLGGLHRYDEIPRGQNIKKTGTKLNEFVIRKFTEQEQISLPENMGEVTIIRG